MSSGFKRKLKLLSSKEYMFNFEDTRFIVITDNALEFPTVPDHKNLKDDSLNMHFHMYYELFYVSDGEIKIEFENETKTIKRGNLLIISPNTMHRVTESAKGKRYNINFVCENNFLVTDLPIYERFSKFLSERYLFWENAEELYEHLRNICIYVSDDKKSALGLQFHDFVKCLFNIASTTGDKDNKTELTKDSEITRKYKLHSIIHNNYNTDLSLEDIAKNLYLSIRQTDRIIQKTYNCSFRELVTRLRMQQAARLLSQSDMTVADIAAAVGYNSICGFYNAFAKRYGQKPSEYRKNLR